MSKLILNAPRVGFPSIFISNAFFWAPQPDERRERIVEEFGDGYDSYANCIRGIKSSMGRMAQIIDEDQIGDGASVSFWKLILLELDFR